VNKKIARALRKQLMEEFTRRKVPMHNFKKYYRKIKKLYTQRIIRRVGDVK